MVKHNVIYKTPGKTLPSDLMSCIWSVQKGVCPLKRGSLAAFQSCFGYVGLRAQPVVILRDFLQLICVFWGFNAW